MSITAGWLSKPYIRHIIITGAVTVSELDSLALGELALLDSCSHVVHYVTEVGYVTGSSFNVFAMDSLKTFTRHPNLGWSTIIGMTPITGFIMVMLQRVTGMHFMPFETIEQAQTYLLKLLQIAQENPLLGVLQGTDTVGEGSA